MHRIAFPIGWSYAPVPLVRWYISRDPVFNLSLSDEERLRRWQHPSRLSTIKHPREMEVMRDTDYLRLSLQSMREALAQGWEWVCQDAALMCTDLGFRVEDVREDLPVQLWYGKDDTFVPMNHGVQIAKRLGCRAELRVEQDTHGSISHRWKREVLQAILAKM
jgi:pimeloyl-ACP methyl ester carboxylesterase